MMNINILLLFFVVTILVMTCANSVDAGCPNSPSNSKNPAACWYNDWRYRDESCKGRGSFNQRFSFKYWFGRCYCCCETDKWFCGEGDSYKCIPNSYRCDGDQDCDDGADELDCFMCNRDRWLCKADKKCISYKWRCDGYESCSDGSDERDCDTCNNNGWLCKADKKCILNVMRCDGHKSCSDGSDEHNCDKCSNGWLCKADRKCIPNSWRCDGIKGCSDGSDELNCDTCGNGWLCRADKKCIENNWKCDGSSDCSDGSDEHNCDTCNNEWLCKADRKCNPYSWTCDGSKDCSDGSDELNCDACSNGFLCKADKKCTPNSWTCDGQEDCSDRSDERNCGNSTLSAAKILSKSTRIASIIIAPLLPELLPAITKLINLASKSGRAAPYIHYLGTIATFVHATGLDQRLIRAVMHGSGRPDQIERLARQIAGKIERPIDEIEEIFKKPRPTPTPIQAHRRYKSRTKGKEECNLDALVGALNAMRTQKLNRMKRSAHDYFDANTCDDLISQVRLNYDTEELAFEKGPMYSVIYSHSGNGKLVHALGAFITNERVGQSYKGFGDVFWNARMRYMQALPGDEKGHLLASQLGGPAEWYNLVPQTPSVNRNIGIHSGWFNIEYDIRKFLNEECGHAEWRIVLNYDPDSRRPKGFKICYGLRDPYNNKLGDDRVEYFDNEIF